MDGWVVLASLVLGLATFALYRLVDHLRKLP
jgi:hypothetical protein